MPQLLNQFQGWSEQGSEPVITETVPSTTLVQRSFPGCVVTVYLAGTTTLATIYSDSGGLTPKANPFQSSVHNSFWFFYGENSTYDVNFSGTGVSQPFTVPVGNITKSAAQLQTPWLQDIDGGGHGLDHVSSVIIRPPGGINPFILFNPSGEVDWTVNTAGDLVSATARGINGLSNISFADGTTQTTAYKGVAATQTPWLQDIVGGGHALTGVGSIDIQSRGDGSPLFLIRRPDTQAAWYVTEDGELGTNIGAGIHGIASVGFSDGTTQATAYRGVAATQTPWLQDINGAGHLLDNISSLIFRPLSGGPGTGLLPLQVLNPAGTNWDWVVNDNGDLQTNTGKQLAGISILRFLDGSAQATAFHGVAATQTPWLQDINGAGYVLSNLKTLSINHDGVGYAFEVWDPAKTVRLWRISAAGGLVTDSGRSIAGILSLGFADASVQTTAYHPGVSRDVIVGGVTFIIRDGIIDDVT